MPKRVIVPAAILLIVAVLFLDHTEYSEPVWVLDRKASAMRSRVDSTTTFEVRSGATDRESGDEDAARSRAQPRATNPNRFSRAPEPIRHGLALQPLVLRDEGCTLRIGNTMFCIR